VAPTSPVAVGTEAFSGWWRIDPVSGQALGMSAEGRGQAMTEFLITVGWAFALGFMFEYLLCQMMSAGEGMVACSCDPSSGRQQLAVADLFVTPVHAAGGDCAWKALFAGLLGGLLGAGLGLGNLGSGGGGKGPAKPSAKSPSDTQPGLGKDPAANPYGDTLPGDPFGGTLPAGAGGPGGTPSAGSPGGKPFDISKFPPAVQKEMLAYEKWKQTEGFPAKADAFNEWITAIRESMKARKPLDPYYNDPMPPGPWPWGPKGATPPPQGPTPSGGTPQTGPGGTQIIRGPGGTEIIPTNQLPSPGGTPPANCPGVGCPPSPIQKTQTGLGGALNALGQKIGG
jgi:hypothetical protein